MEISIDHSRFNKNRLMNNNVCCNSELMGRIGFELLREGRDGVHAEKHQNFPLSQRKREQGQVGT